MAGKFRYKINIHLHPTGNFRVLVVLNGWDYYLEQQGYFQRERGNTSFIFYFNFTTIANRVACCNCEWYTEGIFLTFQSISLFGRNCSLTGIVHKATYYMVRGTLQAPLKLIWKEQSRVPSAVHKTQVGGGREISSLGGLTWRIRSCRKMCYAIYITTSHDFRMGNEKLI